MISFAVGELGLSLLEAYDMTWAEFRIKSFSFRRVRDFEMSMVREVAYQVHCIQYMLSKKSPPKKTQFWRIGDESNTPRLTENQRRLIEQARELKKAKNGIKH